ncbi:MAG: IS66 family transposase [Anaerolineae bacterium]|nr:IS66 family transposase [Anaerolineae bacterium]
MDIGALHAIVEQARSALSAEEHEILKSAVDTLAEVTAELERKGVSIRRLRHLLFGASTERTATVLGEDAREDGEASAEGGAEDGTEENSAVASEGHSAGKTKRKGHGRNGADAYHGAERVKVRHDSLHHGDRCPQCQRGNVYAQRDPQPLIRITGMAPLAAKLYEVERLRCGTCGQVFTASVPAEVGDKKYDESVPSMIAMLKYGTGMPFNRLEKLQRNMGIPLPAATQWELVRDAALPLAPVHNEMIRQAAQGELVQNDDTTMKILEFLAERPHDPVCERKSSERTGVYTTGILSKIGEQRIALFFTGIHHAGENLERVLKERAAALGPPIQMSDGLSHNTAGDFDTIEANCTAHARRYFVDVAPDFPEQCRFVLETLREVYCNDALARRGAMSPTERLRFHQRQSGALMGRLKRWLNQQIKEKQVEPNSSLGEAIRYMQKHWKKLILFLRLPGVPLDNNLVEQALKRAILHRKNALFYKTQNGADVGDRFMSIIHTAELASINPFDYLVQLLRNADRLGEEPAAWVPWRYRETLTNLHQPCADAGPAP